MNLLQNKKTTLWSALEEIRLEIMFNNHLVKNRALLDYKKRPIWSSGHIGIFPKWGPYEFSPKLKKLVFGLLFDEIRLEIMFDDHLVKNRTLLDYEESLFGQVATLEFFQRGDPMNLVQN